MDVDKKQYWYFTFMDRQTLLRDKYVKIFGTYDEARQIMVDNFESKWGFQYETAEKAGVDIYGLKELIEGERG